MSNARKHWTQADHELILRYLQQNNSIDHIAQLLGRSESSIKARKRILFDWIPVNSRELWKKIQTPFTQLPKELHRIIFQFYADYRPVCYNNAFGNIKYYDPKPILCIYPIVQEEKYIEQRNKYSDFMLKEYKYMLKVFKTKYKQLIEYYSNFSNLKSAPRFVIFKNAEKHDKYYITCGDYPHSNYTGFITLAQIDCPPYKALKIQKEIKRLLPPCDKYYCSINKRHINFPNHFTLSQLQINNLLIDIRKLF